MLRAKNGCSKRYASHVFPCTADRHTSNKILDRARKAEAEAAALKAQLKTETSTSKKALREMEATLAESTTLSQKAEREYVTLRDSLKCMTESWKHDMDSLRDDMRKREDKLKKEVEAAGKKYKQLVEEMKTTQEQKTLVRNLQEESLKVRQEIEDEFRGEIRKLGTQVQVQSKQSDEAADTARFVWSFLVTCSIEENVTGFWRVSWLDFADSCNSERSHCLRHMTIPRWTFVRLETPSHDSPPYPFRVR